MVFGNWHNKIGTVQENSSHREAPNKHLKGTKKYKEMIDRGSKKADFWKNLPFTFSKPPKRTRPRRDIFHVCIVCGSVGIISKYTAGRVCGKCKNYISVNAGTSFYSEEELASFLDGLGGTCAD